MCALVFSVMFDDEVSQGVAYAAAIFGGDAFTIALFLVSVDLCQGRRKIVETQLGSELNAVFLGDQGEQRRQSRLELLPHGFRVISRKRFPVPA
jgi:hypothetical protein